MDRRFIVRYMHLRRRGVVLAAAMLVGGCTWGIDPGPFRVLDAGTSDFAIQVTAIGVLVPVALELRMGDAVEVLTVTLEGPFAFETRLDVGASYTVALADPALPCTLQNETGVITTLGARVFLTCTGSTLASVVVSGIAPAVTLVPGTLDYVVDLPLSQPAVTLTAVVVTAGDTLTIAGTPVEGGVPSAEIALNLGDNPVDIVVENALGWRRTYRFTLRRAVQLAQYAYAKASNAGAGDLFGHSVALSGDTLAVGAYQEDSPPPSWDGDPDDDSGAVYVFRRSGATWVQEAYLKASNAGAGDSFGHSVALSGDTLAVGAPNEASEARGVGGDQDSDAAWGSGAVYVFRRTGTAWLQEVYLKASNGTFDHWFGSAVALAGDTLAAGAWGEDSAAQGVGGDQSDSSARDSGAVYVFRRTGTAWLQEAYLKASNTSPDDFFGISVALSGDTLTVGAPHEDSAAQGIGGNQDDDSAEASGAVYVFRRTGTAWLQEAYLKASNAGAYDYFGISMALSGETLAVGAYGEGSAARGVGGNQDDDSAGGSGAVYVFRRAGTTWLQEAYLKAFNSDPLDNFGHSVALAGDALAVGATGEDSATQGIGGDQGDDDAAGSGAVYVFRRAGTAWLPTAHLKASNTDIGDMFGRSVALLGDTIAIGAPEEDSAAQGIGGDQDDEYAWNSGAVYIFH